MNDREEFSRTVLPTSNDPVKTREEEEVHYVAPLMVDSYISSKYSNIMFASVILAFFQPANEMILKNVDEAVKSFTCC